MRGSTGKRRLIGVSETQAGGDKSDFTGIW